MKHQSFQPRPEPASAAGSPSPFPNPVPLRHRADGWTPERQRDFLLALARSGSVTQSTASVGMSRESAHRLKRRPGAEAFARAWDAALILARELYAESLLDKAREGWSESVWYHGEEVGTRDRFSPQLLLAALGRLDRKADGFDRQGDPARIAAGEFDAMVDAIGEGVDCAAMLAAQEEAAIPPHPGEDEAAMLERIASRGRIAAIEAMDPEDVDTADLDPAAMDDWSEEQWARAYRSGMLEEIDYGEDEEEEHEDGDDVDGQVDPGPDACGQADPDGDAVLEALVQELRQNAAGRDRAFRSQPAQPRGLSDGDEYPEANGFSVQGP